MDLGHFNDEAVQKARQLTADKMNFSEADAEVLDFARCQRPDGTYYGTNGQCRKGKEVGAKEKAEKKTKAASGGGTEETTIRTLGATFNGDKKDFAAKKALKEKAAGEFAKSIVSKMDDSFESELRDTIETGGDLDWAMEAVVEKMGSGTKFGPALDSVAKVLPKTKKDAEFFIVDAIEDGALQWARDNDIDTSEWE